MQGRVTASDNGQVEMRLTDGSTLHARVAEGVRLDAGTMVRLQIGERQEGIPTAQVLERLPAGTAVRTDAQSPAQLVGDALRALGEKAVPQLVERALALVRETGMPENQAAFLAANAVEGSDPAASLLGRMLEGQYELGANLRSLAAGMADALVGLPQAERDALLTQQGQTAQLGGLADRLMQAAADKLAAGQPQPGAASDSILSRNGVALSGALREALATLTQSGQTPQSALTVLQNALLPVPGGRVLLSLLLPGMGEAAGRARRYGCGRDGRHDRGNAGVGGRRHEPGRADGRSRYGESECCGDGGRRGSGQHCRCGRAGGRDCGGVGCDGRRRARGQRRPDTADVGRRHPGSRRCRHGRRIGGRGPGGPGRRHGNCGDSGRRVSVES